MIYIRVDASPQIGLGHLMRCLTLAEALKVETDVIFVMRVTEQTVLNIVKERGFKCLTISASLKLEEEVNMVSEWSRLGKPQAVIFDGYHLGQDYQSKLSFNSKIVHIGLLHGSNAVADIVVNPVPWARKADYKDKVKQNAKILVGADYALIRDSIGKTKKHEPRKYIRNVLLTFGGGATNKKVADIYKALKNIPYNFDLALGLKPHEAMPGKPLKNITTHYNVFDMAPLMQTADIAITAAGTTCWELCCIGVPFATLTVEDNQILNDRYLNKNEISISLGNMIDLDPKRLIETISSMANNYEKRTIMSIKGRSLIDGLGSYRVAEEILNFKA
jgi:UDP-2,4-diacetamido-2,4,6-trideoxy-beta-L-altropyranose hydrolase